MREFTLPKGMEWNFKKYKYGISDGRATGEGRYGGPQRIHEGTVHRGDRKLVRRITKFLSEPGKTSLDVLSHVLRHEKDRNTSPDYVMLLEITHPLRPPGIINQLVETTKKQTVDSLVTVHPVHYNFWKKNEDGDVNRIEGSGDNQGISIYQELIGICSIFRSDFFSIANPFGEQIDMVPIERFWATIDVRNEDGLWLAERYLDKIKKTK